MLRIARLPILLLLVVPLAVQSQTKKTCPTDVYDVLPPEIVCPANITMIADSTGTAYLGDYSPLLVVDACSITPSIMQSPVACTILKVQNEAYLVTLVAIDDNHNAAACSFRVMLKAEGSGQKAEGSGPAKAEDGL